jgi:hypothetical protein
LAQNSLEFLISSSARSASERLVLSSQIEQRKASEEPGVIRVCALARLKLHAIELWVIRHASRRMLVYGRIFAFYRRPIEGCYKSVMRSEISRVKIRLVSAFLVATPVVKYLRRSVSSRGLGWPPLMGTTKWRRLARRPSGNIE